MSVAEPLRRRLHVLVVEDDEDHADLVGHALAAAPAVEGVAHVADGPAALDYLHRRGDHAAARRPDLVLLDLKLPLMSGIEVLERLKADPDLRAIPVVVLSTSDAEVDRVRAYRAHVNSYLVKPTRYECFRRLLEELSDYWGRWNVGV